MSKYLDKKLKHLIPYTPGEQPKRDRIIKLNTNESPFPPSNAVISAVKETLSTLNLYSDSTCDAAVTAIADSLGLDKSRVLLTNGSDESLAFIFYGLSPKGAAFPDITYGFYRVLSDLYNIQTRVVPLDPRFRVNIEDYKGLQQTIYIANPNAPTGISLSKNDIVGLLLQNPDRLLVVDEAYVDFGGESVADLVDKFDNLIVVRTFSKSRNLAGARIGFVLADSEVIKDLQKIKYSFNPYSVNSMSLAAAKASIQDQKYFLDCIDTIKKTRALTAKSLTDKGFLVLDSSTNFLMVGQHKRLTAKDYYEKLKQNNILVRYFAQERIKDFVRITIGSKENMEQLLAVTDNILKGQ